MRVTGSKEVSDSSCAEERQSAGSGGMERMSVRERWEWKWRNHNGTWGTPNGVVLCVDRAEGHRFSGRFYHAYSREALSFMDMDSAIFELELFYDSLNFPHPTTDSRSFGEERHRSRQEKQERKRAMKDEELLSMHGDLGTFIIRVQHRQNSSWQGRITWMDKK